MKINSRPAYIHNALYYRGGQPDELQEPYFSRQEPQIYLSSQMYSSNTGHCLREHSQHFLLATKGTTACWGIQWSMNKNKTFFPYWMESYFCSSNCNKLAAISYKSFFTHSFKMPFRSASCACKLPEYYFYRQLVWVVLVKCVGHMQLMSHIVATSAILTWTYTYNRYKLII